MVSGVKRLLLSVVVMIGGVMFTVIGIGLSWKFVAYQPVDAVVERVEYLGYDGEDEKYEVDLSYVADGAALRTTVEETNTSLREGSTVTLRYDPKAPEKVLYASPIAPFAALFLGVSCLLGGALFVLRGGRTFIGG